MVGRKASQSRSRSRGRRRGGGVKKATKGRGRGSGAGAFLNFVRSMRDLFPGHAPDRLKHDSKAIWREMGTDDRSMYTSTRLMCGPGRRSRRSGRGRGRGRSRSRSRSRSRRRRRPG